jgi:hypothetical protein
LRGNDEQGKPSLTRLRGNDEQGKPSLTRLRGNDEQGKPSPAARLRGNVEISRHPRESGDPVSL